MNPILREEKLLEIIASKLGLTSFDETAFLKSVDRILVQEDGELTLKLAANAA